MLVIGLTGGIGSGKSAASDYFAKLGVNIVDADIVARQVVEPGRPALVSITSQFGQDILDENGSLNRKQLRNIIFSDDNAKQWLECLLHPIIRSEILAQLSESTSAYCILVSPLLFETKQSELCSRTLLIDTSEQLQLQRASARDKTTESAIQRIIDTQLSREKKHQLADDILLNDGTLNDLKTKVETLHQTYLQMAAKKSGE